MSGHTLDTLRAALASGTDGRDSYPHDDHDDRARVARGFPVGAK